jgi:hypothetical protein
MVVTRFISLAPPRFAMTGVSAAFIRKLAHHQGVALVHCSVLRGLGSAFAHSVRRFAQRQCAVLDADLSLDAQAQLIQYRLGNPKAV